MSATADTRRPFGVTLIAILIWLSGIVNVIGGIVLLLARDNAQVKLELGANSDTLVIIGIVSIVVGLVTLAVAGGIRRGSGFARVLVSLLLLLQLAGAIYVLVQVPSQYVASWVNVGVSLVALLLLWGPQANRFFAAH